MFFTSSYFDHSGARHEREQDRSQSVKWLRSGSMPLGQHNFGTQTCQGAHFCDANGDVKHDSFPPKELADLFRPKNAYKGSPGLSRINSHSGETFVGGSRGPGVAHNAKDDHCLGSLGAYSLATGVSASGMSYGVVARAPKALMGAQPKYPWKKTTQLTPSAPLVTDFWLSRYKVEHNGGPKPSTAPSTDDAQKDAAVTREAVDVKAVVTKKSLRRCGTAPAGKVVDEPAWPCSHYQSCYQAPGAERVPRAALWDAGSISRGRFRVK